MGKGGFMPTRKEIHAARSGRGGWTRAQLGVWGVPWPPPKGWIDTLVKVSSGQIERPREWATEIEGLKLPRKGRKRPGKLPAPPTEDWRPRGSLY
jgi:hypothetical protein